MRLRSWIHGWIGSWQENRPLFSEGAIRVLDALRPDQVAVLSCAENLTPEQADEVRSNWDMAFSGKAVVLGPGLSLDVVSAEKPLPKQHAEEAQRPKDGSSNEPNA